MIYIIGILISYLLGSIPMGLLLTKMMGKGDLRKVGSGNIGATNVMRVGGLRMAGLVWLLDMAKAIAAVLIGRSIAGDADFAAAFGAWCGFAAIIGHCYPVWLRFRGGKGISSLFGVMLAINPIIFAICGAIWLTVALITKISSMGAVFVFCLIPFIGFYIGNNMGWPFLAIGLICMWRHRENIKRLVRGTESKIEWKWKK